MTKRRDLEPVADRDFPAEMAAIVRAECVGAYKAPEMAAEIVAKLRATDPDLLIGFFGLERTMVNGLRDYINHWNRSLRYRDRHQARQAVRSEVRQRFERAVESGETAPLRESASTNFLGQRFVVNGEGLQMPYGQTGKPERLYIINDYASQESWAGLHKAYHMAVQRKCRNRVTADVLGEEQLAEMYLSTVGDAA